MTENLHMTLRINGEPLQLSFPALQDPSGGAARRARPDGHQARLRTRRVRRLRRPRRRRAGPLLPDPRARMRGSRDHHGRRPAPDGELHPLQEAFADLGGSQCGYCTPGILVTAKALLGPHPDPTGSRSGSAVGQSLPLHRLPADLRVRRGGDCAPAARPRTERSRRRMTTNSRGSLQRRRQAAPPRRRASQGHRADASSPTTCPAAHAALQAAALSAPHARILSVDARGRRRTRACTWC